MRTVTASYQEFSSVGIEIIRIKIRNLKAGENFHEQIKNDSS
jgi:hypothetical protein